MRVERRRLVERWWNGTYGRLARRDLWLWQGDTSWTVERCLGQPGHRTPTRMELCRRVRCARVATAVHRDQWRGLAWTADRAPITDWRAREATLGVPVAPLVGLHTPPRDR